MLNILKRSMSSLKPLSSKKVIVIAGTTGVGKSDLSIQLAKKFNGEIINSDSMQVYKDAPIITNKHPIEERLGIPHHVMNHVNWSENYFLHRFEDECLAAIDDIHSRDKIPIIVGGTHYYMQTLFNKHLEKAENATRKMTDEESLILNSNNPNLIFNTLLKLDPNIAHKFHPNDTRRVKRMLEICYTTGKTPTENYSNQKIQLRFDTLFLWLYSVPETLNKRLDDRVDKMLDSGGMEEINQLYDYYKKNNMTRDDCENGVWQVIGFKEFLPWLEKNNADSDNNVILDDGIEKMKIRTRQYAKRQVKWIRKMLIPDINGDIYILNASDLSKWHKLVCDRSIDIASSFMTNEKIIQDHAPDELKFLLPDATEFSTINNKPKAHYTCTICKDHDDNELILVGKDIWNIHLKSRRHRSNLNRGSKKLAYENWKKNKNNTTSEQSN